MCLVCDTVYAMVPADATTLGLAKIRNAIISGADPEHFKPLLDRVLECEVPDRDTSAEEAYTHRFFNP